MGLCGPSVFDIKPACWVCAEMSSLPPLRRPANVKSTCQNQEAAQLCFLPPLWGEIVLEKSISRAGQSLKLILLFLLSRTLCAPKNTFSCWDWIKAKRAWAEHVGWQPTALIHSTCCVSLQQSTWEAGSLSTSTLWGRLFHCCLFQRAIFRFLLSHSNPVNCL